VIVRALTLIAALTLALAAPAQAADDFFAGKTIRIYNGGGAGGTSGMAAHLMAEHLPRFLPGAQVIPQFMEGAGGTRAIDYVVNAAPRDGTAWGIALPTALTTPLLYPQQVKYDPRKMIWLGSLIGYTSVISVLDNAPARTIDAAKTTELIIGATGVGSPAYQEPAIVKAVLGTKFKIVTGYKGGSEVTLAMERGEVHGRAMVTNGWEAQAPHWVKDNRLVHLVQLGPGDPKRMPAVPKLIDLAPDSKKPIVRFYEAAPRAGWAVFLPPDVPAERVAVIRKAYAALVADPKFIADIADRAKADVLDLQGAAFQRIVDDVMATPEPIVAEVRQIYGEGK
jgi:tripartite-type tricarboxylate transporter receptor subunit TctC